VQVCRFNCPEPVCGDIGSSGGPIAADLPSLQLAASPSSASAAYASPNQRSFQVDPRLPSRPAGLVMDEDALDQLRAPSTAAQQALAAAAQQYIAGSTTLLIRDIQRLPTTPFSLELRKEYVDCPQRDSHAVHYI
jgi:hypothetical protein